MQSIRQFYLALAASCFMATVAEASISASADYRPGSTPGGGVLIVDGSASSTGLLLSSPGSIVDEVTVTVDLTKSGFGINSVGIPTGNPNSFTFNNEIVLNLTSPMGTIVQLVDAGTFSGQFRSTSAIFTFSDTAATAVGGSSLISGTYQPVGLLSDFVGEVVSGTWTLGFEDTAGGDPLSINAFSLDVRPQEIAAIPEPTMFLVWAGLACCGFATRRLR